MLSRAVGFEGVVRAMPTPFNSISHVVALGPQDQVVRVDTGRVVALVTNDETIGNGTDVQLVANTMSRSTPVFDAERTVSMTRAFCPDPAAWSNVELGLEAIT